MIKDFTRNKKMIKNIISTIKKHDKIALFHHLFPDGDAVSSSYGLMLALREKFPKKQIVFVGNKEYLLKHFAFLDFDEKDFVEKIDENYLTIIGDVSVLERIENYEEFQKGKEKICFDHHQNESDLNANIFWHEPNWGASAMQAALIAFGLKKTFSERTAFFLVVGLLTDTNNFSYTQADVKGPYLYSQLIQFISNERMDKLFLSFKERTKKDIKIAQYILNNIKYNKNVSYLIAEYSDVEKFGDGGLPIKLKVNSIGNIKNYPIWAMFVHTKNNKDLPWEISFRSSGPNVKEVASKYNGGGHIRAAGAMVKNKEEIKKVLVDLNKAAKKFKN